jgi:hypothetical protein
MTNLHPDVQVYLKKISEFFIKNPQNFEQLFGSHSFDRTISAVQVVATRNQAENGEPLLSIEQFREVRQLLDQQVKKEKVAHLFFQRGWVCFGLN